jgi:hypothetical protein
MNRRLVEPSRRSSRKQLRSLFRRRKPRRRRPIAALQWHVEEMAGLIGPWFRSNGTRRGAASEVCYGNRGEGENMASWRQCIASAGAACFALTPASPSIAQSGGAVAQSVAIFWNAAECDGGYQSDFYSAHCEPGPSAARGPPIPPSKIIWRPECFKAPLGFDVDPDTTILVPQYSQSPPPNYYMTMNVVVLYDSAKTTIKVCLVPLFPKLPVEPACADAEMRS